MRTSGCGLHRKMEGSFEEGLHMHMHFFFLLCLNSSEIRNLARKKGKYAFGQAVVRPVFSFLSY